MKKLILFSLLSFAAYAQVQVQIIDPEIDPDTFNGDGYSVQTKEIRHNVIPEMDKREKIFEGVKLPAKWDQLDKDIFYMDLKSKSIEKLQLKYPDISVKQLKQLKAKRG